jgi:nucleoside-diphosphate-sugar epimerase
MEKENSGGQIYNVVDPDRITKKDYMELLIRKMYPHARFFYLPYSLLHYMVLFQEKAFNAIKLRPAITCYRLISSQKPIIYDASKIMNDLDWRPKVSFEKAVEKIVEQSKSGRIR